MNVADVDIRKTSDNVNLLFLIIKQLRFPFNKSTSEESFILTYLCTTLS